MEKKLFGQQKFVPVLRGSVSVSNGWFFFGGSLPKPNSIRKPRLKLIRLKESTGERSMAQMKAANVNSIGLHHERQSRNTS